MTTDASNQPPPFEGTDLLACDPALQAAVERHVPGAMEALRDWSATVSAPDTYALAESANRNPPTLRTYDRRGERVDDVEFHPAWHGLMQLAASAGEHCSPWQAPGPGAQVARAAMYYLHAQV